jgi:hypothetical protein
MLEWSGWYHGRGIGLGGIMPTREDLIRLGVIRPVIEPPLPTVFLDESGTFEGEGTPVVAGIFVPAQVSPEVVKRALEAGLAAWGYPETPLPKEDRPGKPQVEGIHAHRMRKAQPERHRRFLETVLDVLEASDIRILALRDECRTQGIDRNVAYAAVVSRGLATYLAENPPDPPIRLVIAGRAVSDATDTNSSLGVMLQARVTEELAVRGLRHSRLIHSVDVRHIKPEDFGNEQQMPLMIADVLANLLFSGAETYQEAFGRATKLMLPGCPVEILPRKEHDLEAMLKRHGPGAFLVWYYGPAGPSAPSAREQEIETKATAALRTCESPAPALAAFGEAVDRLANQARDLGAAERMARRLLSLTEELAVVHGASATTLYEYAARNALLDACNHRGDLEAAHRWIVDERKHDRARREGLLLQALEFDNRAAETAVNAYDFEGAAQRLDALIEESSKLVHPVRGRILSHRAQVHHYLGEDDQALLLYERCEPSYDGARDRLLLAHHRIRSLIGLGRLDDARALLAGLGVRDDLTGALDQGPFLLDLVVLFVRAAMAPGRAESSLARTVSSSVTALRGLEYCDYPGAATLTNLAAIASVAGQHDEAVACIAAALDLLGGTRHLTLKTVALGAALEGLAVLKAANREESPEAGAWLATARRLLEEITGKKSVDTVRERFLDLREALSSTKACETAEHWRMLAARVPFGRVGGCTKPLG